MLPKVVADAIAVYENAWHDFLRRGFHLQVRPYKDNVACMTPGVADNVLRANIRAAAKERGIPYIHGWGPNPDDPVSFGLDWQTEATGYELVVPKKRKTERAQALLRLSHQSTDGHRHHAERYEGRTILRVQMSTYSATPAGFAMAQKRWTAITRALATNNDIRSQMGLPLFTGGVTERVAA
jgi:hypothetical protein